MTEKLANLPRVVGIKTAKGFRWDCPHCGKSHMRIVYTPSGVPIVPDLVRCKAREKRRERWARLVKVFG